MSQDVLLSASMSKTYYNKKKNQVPFSSRRSLAATEEELGRGTFSPLKKTWKATPWPWRVCLICSSLGGKR